jgi:hypothetical protein
MSLTERSAGESTAKLSCFGKLIKSPVLKTQTDEVDEKSRRRFVLRYYRVEQCELPQAVLGTAEDCDAPSRSSRGLLQWDRDWRSPDSSAAVIFEAGCTKLQ